MDDRRINEWLLLVMLIKDFKTALRFCCLNKKVTIGDIVASLAGQKISHVFNWYAD